MINDTFLTKCLEMLKRDEIKQEFKILIRPIIEVILQELYPYIYLSILFVLFSFFLTLGIFILLFRMRFATTRKE